MLDFDDLDAVAAERQACGEELNEAALAALGCAQPPKEWPGGYLPPLSFNPPGLPGRNDLPQRVRELLEERIDSSPKIRLFLFYGAGDSVAMWVNFINAIPNWIDLAVYEWPGHGIRQGEKRSESISELALDAFDVLNACLGQHACGGSIEGAPFAFMSHSMGTQLMVEVSALVLRKLGIEPVAVFALDLHPPDHALLTNDGYQMLMSGNPLVWSAVNPTILKMVQDGATSKEPGKSMLAMWENDLRICQEHCRAEGSHKFHCRIDAFYALRDVSLLLSQAKTSRDHRDLVASIYASRPGCPNMYWKDDLKKWKHWTTRECFCHDVDVTHNDMKVNVEIREIVFGVLDGLLSHQ